ncbi:MAG: hypothetical protein ABI325_01810 [Ginsengibacter sp.]
MKRIIFLCLLVLCSASIFATNLSDAPEKVLKIFHRDYPEAHNETVYHIGDSYMIYFKNANDNSVYRIYYNKAGNILQTMRYYSAEELIPFIRSRVNTKYKNKTISSVTDVTNDSGHFYQIVIEDKKSWIYLNVDEKGNMVVEKKLHKQK